MISELYINNILVDLYDDVEIGLSYQMSDIRNINERSTNFSYSITIPGTKKNNTLLGNIFEIGNDNVVYNPNRKAIARLVVGGNQIFNGYMQLLKVRRDNDVKIEYDVVLFGQSGDLLSSIGEGDIDELDFSEYDHDYTRLNIINSFQTSIKKNSEDIPFQFGQGYIYPYIQQGVNTSSTVEVEELKPAIYVKEVFDKIVNEAGYNYRSEFLNSSYFKKLIIPFNKENILLSDEQIANRSASISRASTNDYITRTPTIAGTFIHYPLFNNVVSDPNSNIGGQYVFNVPKKGRYRIQSLLALFNTYDTTGTYPFYIVGGNITANIHIIKNGYIIYTLPTFVSYTAGANLSAASFYTTESLDYTVNANPGDYIYIQVDWTIPSSTYPSKIVNVLGQAINGSIQLGIIPGSTFSVTAYNDGITEGDPLSMNLAIPEGIKKKDFVQSIFRMFNLVVLQDGDKENSVLIEPRDNYFRSGGEVKDWTKKLNRSSYEIVPLSEIQNKSYVFEYKPDSDHYNSEYQKSYSETFGYYRYDVDNDFVDNTENIDIIFSPTPNATDLYTQLSAPHFLTYDNNGTAKRTNTNIRILFYDGVKTGTLTFNSALESPSSLEIETYPYVGMTNDPDNPTESLVFGTTKTVYDSPTSWTDSNLFNKFHKNFIEEITDKNSKMLIGYFHLTPYDIATFDFRDKILIDNVYWRINLIDNYSPTENGLTRVELFSLKDPGVFIPTIKDIPTGIYGSYTAISASNEVIGPVPTFKPPTASANNNNVISVETTVQGSDSNIGYNTKGTVIGDENDVGDGSTVFIIGSGNTVSSNANNVVILGSNDNVVTSSDVVILDNSFVFKGGSGPIPLVDLIESGEDIVQNPFNKLVAIDIVDSGVDSPRPLGSDSIVHIVDSGQDIVDPNSQI